MTPRSYAWSARCSLEQNDEWQLQRRYMQLEGLKVVATITFPGSQPWLTATIGNPPEPVLHHPVGHDQALPR